MGILVSNLVLLTNQKMSLLPEQKLATYFKLKPLDLNSVPGVT
jgi:hypothetical protein